MLQWLLIEKWGHNRPSQSNPSNPWIDPIRAQLWLGLRLGSVLDLEIVIFVAQLTVAEFVCRPEDWRRPAILSSKRGHVGGKLCRSSVTWVCKLLRVELHIRRKHSQSWHECFLIPAFASVFLHITYACNMTTRYVSDVTTPRVLVYWKRHEMETGTKYKLMQL